MNNKQKLNEFGKKRPALGFLFVLLAAILTSLAGGINGTALEMGLAALVIVGFDLLFAGGAGVGWNSVPNRFNRSSWRSLASWRHARSVAILVLATAGFKLLFIFAQRLVPVAMVAVIYYATQSLPSVWDGLRMRKAKALVSPALAVLGVVLFTEPWSSDRADWRGVVLALGAGFSRLVFFECSRRNHEHDGTDRKAAALANLVCGIGILAAAVPLGEDLDRVGNWAVLGMLVSLGIIASAVPVELQLRGQRHISRAQFSIIRSISPVFAALVGVVLLGQALDAFQVAAVIVSTLALLAAKLFEIRPEAPGEGARS